MAERQTEIQIPQRDADEPPATAQQLQRIRQLTTGLSLQGYRFDYRKLGTHQADTILQQLNNMNDQQDIAPPREQGPGCIASLAKTTTALIVWALILAAVAGGAYLIYWRINQPQNQNTATTTTPSTPDSDASAAAPSNPTTPGNTSTSTIFEGLGVSDNNPSTPTTPADPAPDTTPTPTPQTPAAPTLDPALTHQLADLEKLLVSLSQYTRSDFPPDIRLQSSQAMQRKLDDLPQALAALNTLNPTLPPRIRAVIDAFAADPIDGQALREEIKTIRQAIEKSQ